MTMTPDQVQSMLKAEREDALNVNNMTLADQRKTALAYYLGKMDADMPSIDGRSSAVSTDVSDTIEGMMPQLMEIFAASEEVVRFDPVGPEDEDAAAQETDYVNHVFMQRNPGFLILYSFIKDALLEKIGIVKVYWDTWERQERETYANLSEQAYIGIQAAVQLDGDTDITSTTQSTDDYGQTVYTVVLTTKKNYGCAKAEPVPPEEWGISKRARNIRCATYCYHEPGGVAESDLIAQGYDETQVRDLPDAEEGRAVHSVIRDNRDLGVGSYVDANKAMRPVKITEHYIRMDYEQDNCPQLYRVTTGGEKYEILLKYGEPDIELVDDIPFSAMTPIILPHRVFGRSVAELVMDIQKIKTALIRALLDNAYLANNQRVEVAESYAHERTLDDLLVQRPGGVVRTKQPGGIIPIPNQPIGDFVFPLVEYLDQTREWRTGVSRQGQGIDANALQNQSATAVNQLFTALQAKVKLIARIMAETGIRDLFALMHAVIRKNDRQQNTVRLRNRWVPVDPRNWKTRDDMTINVGLGTGSKDQQIAHLMTILGLQSQAMQNQAPIVTWKQIYNTAAKLCEKVDLKSADPYFVDPDSPQGQQLAQQAAQKAQQQPNPAAAKVQGQLQLAAQDQQQDQQKAQLDAMFRAKEQQLDEQTAQANAALKVREQNLDAQLERERIAADAKAKIVAAAIGGHSRVLSNATRPIKVSGA